MKIRYMLLFFFGIILSSKSIAFQLVTEDEYATEIALADATPRLFGKRPDPDGPKIRVELPKNRQVNSPFDIKVIFEPKDGATIDTDSLAIFYGNWGNVTKRVLKEARVSEQGIDAKGAEAPRGNHTFRIQVDDSNGRTGEARITVRVI